VLLCPLHLPLALVEDAELQVGFRVLRVEGQYRIVGFGGPGLVFQGESGLP
jgi:hypothetical protein